MRLLDPEAIEAEIAASVDRSSGGTARATLFNLVLFDNIAKPSRAAAAVEELVGRRPARILHVQSGYEGLTQARVSSRCYPDRRNREVCFEEVHILNGTDNLGLDPGSWSALLIRDLPVFGLLADPRRPLAVQAASLADIADKVIFDSSESETEAWSLFADLARLRPPDGRPALSDFAWLRLIALRRVLARAFETDRAAGQWNAIAALDVTGGPFAEAALLALWLASRLGWRATSVWRSEALFEDARGVGVRFSHAKARGEREIALSLDGGECLQIACAGDRVRLRHFDGATSETAAPAAGAGGLLLREVDTLRGDPLYDDAIAAAAALAANADGAPGGLTE